jgi:hypothetical protein
MRIKRKAIVVDNVDADKKDRLKLRILPELKDVDDYKLPIVLPLYGTGNKDSVNRVIPEIDSIIYVELDDDFTVRSMRYKYNVSVLDNTKYDDIKTNVDAITDIVSTYDYPQPNEYFKFKDGSYSFRNTETGEFVFCHNSGVYTIYDEDGNITTYTKDKHFKVYNDKLSLELKDTGDYLFTNEKVTCDIKNSGDIKINNEKVTIDTKNTGDIKVNNTNVTLEMKDLGDFVLKNTVSEVSSTLAGLMKVKNSTCTVEIGIASVKINNNLEVLI